MTPIIRCRADRNAGRLEDVTPSIDGAHHPGARGEGEGVRAGAPEDVPAAAVRTDWNRPFGHVELARPESFRTAGTDVQALFELAWRDLSWGIYPVHLENPLCNPNRSS